MNPNNVYDFEETLNEIELGLDLENLKSQIL